MIASIIGVIRRVANRRAGRTDAYNLPPEASGWVDKAWGRDVNGCLGEMALSKVLDRHWSGAYSEHDVGFGYQVRVTERPTGHLLLHPPPADDPDAVFVLVVGPLHSPIKETSGPDFRIVGWIHGRDGMRDELWRKGKRPCYWVPQRALNPNLKEIPR